MKSHFRLPSLFALFLMLPLTASADIISRNDAAQRAAEYLDGVQMLVPVTTTARLAPVRKRPSGVSDAPAYYVFSRGEGRGYVIVSADDQTDAVLGYTDSGDFDYARLPENMRAWLDDCEQQLMDLRRVTRTGTDGRARAPRRAAAVPTHPAIPYLMTTKWNQGAPYNDECPLYTDGRRCVTGCVATAMAQVMYHQRAKSVDKTTKAIPAYNTGEIQVAGIPKSSPIDWDNMRDDGGSTAKQRLAVAQLMHYCGVSVEMMYTSGASAAYSYRVAEALVNYFGYGSSVKYISRGAYSNSGWDAVIYNELAHGNPVYLSGANSEAGHAFVCDGYDGKRNYHINWGWGGQSDGYYLLNKLTPGSQGIGGSSDGYNDYQEAIIGAVPANYSKKTIPFADSSVRRACVAAWDTDGDGQLSYGEAAKVTDLGDAFKGTRIKTFTELSEFTKLKTIPDEAFAGCAQLTSITLPETLTAIDANAFNGCRTLKNLLLPTTVATIGEGAFRDCRALTAIDIAAATVIAPHTFQGCAALTAFEVPAAVTAIGDSAFVGCTKLKTFTVNTPTPEAMATGEGLFDGLDLGAATLNIPAGQRPFYEEAPQWSSFGTLYEVRSMPEDKYTTLTTDRKLYLYNVGTQAYLTKGEAWGTQAIVGGEPMAFELRHDTDMPDGQYYLYSDDTGNDKHILFRTMADEKVGSGVRCCFVDGYLSENAYWVIEELEGGRYRLSVPQGKSGYIKDRYLGIQLNHKTGARPANVNTTMGAYFDVAYNGHEENCQWMFVDVEDTYGEYDAANELQNLLAMAKTKRINAEREQAVLDDLQSTKADLVKAQRTLRKKLSLIHFDDETVKAICTTQWDIDGNGEISYAEAQKVDDVEFDFQGRRIHNLDALENCTSLYFLAGNSFKDCTELTSIRLPENLVGMYYQVFKNCTSLTEIDIPSHVTLFGTNCFEGCTSLRTFRIANAYPESIEMGEQMFKGVDLSAVTLYVPRGAKEAYAAAPVWKDFGEIREMRSFTMPAYAPLTEDEQVLIYNIGTRACIANGEAYGTQAVVDGSGGIAYRVLRKQNMAEGTYYLQGEFSGNNILFRTDTDSRVGKGVRTCFVDGTLSNKAHWVIAPVEGKENVYTFQIPSNQAGYVEGEYLGIDPGHATSAVDEGDPTYGLYWDIPYAENTENCQWAFVRLSDINAEHEHNATADKLKMLIARANAKALDTTAEQAVLDNLDSTTPDMEDAITALRQKLQYIEFDDDRVKQLCIARFDLDEDDELSVDEAAAATTFGQTFKGNASIRQLDELRYFTNVTAVGPEAFKGCTNLVSITLPEKIQSLERDAFAGCYKLRYIRLLNPSATAATLGDAHLPEAVNVFVEPTAAEAYAAAEAWQDITVSAYTGTPVVSAKPATRYYGYTNPTFIMAVMGAPVEGEAAFSTDATKTSPAGEYAVNTAAGTITTEGVTFTPGRLTVQPAPLTITAKSYTIKSGQPLPDFELTFSGFRNSEKAETALTQQPVVTCEATATSPVGEYAIIVSGAEATNYAITYVNGTLTIDYPDGITPLTGEGSGVGQNENYAPVFNLAGQRVAKPQRGIFIVRGKKILK